MLLQTTDQAVEVQGAEEDATSFSIAMNGKAFKVLSSTLYANKIGSIVRELCTNGLDAHIMQGNVSEPFLIHLPDEFEPWFSVQDFGVGLSPEGVKGLYSTYFASSKDQSNECTGMLGLGSKTPFSYTDQFTVTSNFNGMKYFFSAYLTPIGIPAVQLMHSEETQERNGVEIKISVKKEDYRKFADEAKQQLRFFKVKPIVENAPHGFEFNNLFDAEGVASTANFKLIRDRYRGSFIVQGPIGYPFDQSEFNSKSTNEEAIKIASRLCTAGAFYLECPIGSIGVTASREAMEYTDVTVKAIEDGLIAAYKEIQQSFVAKVSTSSNNWEIAQISNETDMFGDKEIYKKAFNNSQAIPEVYRNVFCFPLDANKFQGFTFNTWHRKGTGMGMNHIQASGGQVIYIADACKFQKQRIASLRNNRNFILVRIAEGFTQSDLQVALGGYKDFKLISDVQYTPTTRAAYKSTKTQCWRYKNHQGTNIREWSKIPAQDAPEDTDCIYVEVEKLELVKSYDSSNVWTYQEFANQGFDIPELYGIRPKDVASFKENNPNAVSLQEWIDAKKKEIHTDLKKVMKYSEWKSATEISLSGAVMEVLAEMQDSKIARVIALHSKLNTRINQKIKTIALRLGYTAPKGSFANNLAAVTLKEVQKRPLLALDSWSLSQKLTREQLKAYLSVEL